MDFPSKKRHRVPASCSVCRKRKSKCDRIKPVCGTCKKKSIAHLCYYEGDSKSSTSSTVSINEIIPLPVPNQQQLPPSLPNYYPMQQPLPPPHLQPTNIVQQPPLTSSSQFKSNQGPVQATNQLPPPPPQLIPPTGTTSQPLSSSSSYSYIQSDQIDKSYIPPQTSISLNANRQSFDKRSSIDSNISSHSPFNTQIPPPLPQQHPQHQQQHSPQVPIQPPYVGGVPLQSNISPVGYTPSDQRPSSNTSISNINNSGNNKNGSENSSNNGNNQYGFHSPTSTSNLSPGIQNQFSHSHSHSQSHSQSQPLVSQQPPSVNSQSHPTTSPKQNSITSNATTSFSSSSLVAIPLGPNSTLQVNPDDQMNIFTNASFSLNLEGSLWQVQGTLSYIGLTKSDPFIKVLRNYAVLLFKSGEMTKFIKTETVRRKKRSMYTSSGVPSVSGNTSSPSSLVGRSIEGTPKRPKIDPFTGSSLGPSPSSVTLENESRKDLEDDPEDLVEADALIVTKIKVNKDDEDEEEGSSNNSSKNTTNDDDPSTQIKVDLRDSTNHQEDKNDSLKDGSTNGSSKEKTTHSSSSDIISMLPNLRRSLFSGKKSRSEYFRLIEKIVVSILPNKLNMFMLFCRFFKYCHPFIPILDENSLLIDLNTLLDNFPNFTRDYYTEVSIENENELNIIGIFLVILRIGYMSLIHNDDINNVYTDDEKSMIMDMKRVNSENFTSILNLCISDELIAVKSSFRLVQHLTLVYFYRQVAPDDCHGLGGADSNILFGVIIRHAMSIGLNRDPTFYVAHDTIIKREALIKSWRSLWNYLMTNDAVSAIHAGTTLNIPNIEICDVELPLVDDDKSGQFNDTIKRISTICDSYRNIVKKINNVHNKPRVIEILLETNQLEKIFFDFFGKDFFKDFICKPAKVPEEGSSFESNSKDHEESFLKVIKFCTFIQLRTNLSCMYYMIAIHYENEYNESQTPSMNAGIELFKIYIKSVVQLVYIMSFVLDNSVELFGKGYDYYLTANNERCMIKTHSFLTSFFARLLHYKMDLTLAVRNDPTIKPKLDVTDTLFSMVLIEAELFVGNFRKLSRTYINSYKLYVMTYFVLMQCMENPSVFFQTSIQYPRFFHKGTNMLEFFTISELQYLCKLCEEFRSAKEGQKKQKIAKASQLRKSEATYTHPSTSTEDSLQNAFGHPATAGTQLSKFNAFNNNLKKNEFANATHMPQFNSTSSQSSPIGGETTRTMPVAGLGQGATVIGGLDYGASTDNSNTGHVGNGKSSDPSYSALNNFSYDIFDQPNLGGEDILKLFEVYGDLDKEF